MKVAICRTKGSKNGDRFHNSLISSVESQGFTPVVIDKRKTVRQDLQLCDVAVSVGYNKELSIRKQVSVAAKEFDIPMLYFDRGIFDGTENYLISVNQPKRKGTQYLDNFKDDSTRWDGVFRKRLSNIFPDSNQYIDLHEWKYNKNNLATILFHNPMGFKSNLVSVNQQLTEMYELKATLEFNYSVQVSYHPKPFKFGYSKKQPLKWEDILKSDVCVGWHSNSLFNTILYGIPGICLDEYSMAYDMCTHNLEDPFIYPDRQPWVNAVSWGCWEIPEIANGDFWNVILDYIPAKGSGTNSKCTT